MSSLPKSLHLCIYEIPKSKLAIFFCHIDNSYDFCRLESISYIPSIISIQAIPNFNFFPFLTYRFLVRLDKPVNIGLEDTSASVRSFPILFHF